MESLEISAKTAEEAIERGLQQLGLARDQVECVIVSKGKSGFLGMGAEDAVVRLTPLRSTPLSEEPLSERLCLRLQNRPRGPAHPPPPRGLPGKRATSRPPPRRPWKRYCRG